MSHEHQRSFGEALMEALESEADIIDLLWDRRLWKEPVADDRADGAVTGERISD
jgi:hypothetical protein